MAVVEVEAPLALKDFVGCELGVTEWFTIAQDRINQFAEATGDRQWIHLDRERAAKESAFGGTIAHGFLTLSLLGHFMSQVLNIRGGVRMIVNYGLNRVRFPAPVLADSRVRARFTLKSFKELTGCVEVVFLVSVDGEKTVKPCCVAEWVIRYYL